MRNVMLTLGFITLAALWSLTAYSENAFANHASYQGYGVAATQSSALN